MSSALHLEDRTPSAGGWGPAGAALLVIAVLAGCAFSRQPISGLAVEEGSTPTLTADRFHTVIQTVSRAMSQAPLPAKESEADAAAGRIAALEVLDRYVSLVSETLKSHTGMDPYDYQDRRTPLFIHPRITCPHLAEAVDLPGGRAWVLPVILNRNAFRLRSRPSWVLGSLLSPLIPDPRSELPDDPGELAAAVLKDFRFSLFPTGLKTYDEVDLDEPPAGAIELPALEVPLGTGPARLFRRAAKEVVRFPNAGKNVLDFAFRLPVSVLEDRRRKIGAAAGGSPGGELFSLRMFPRLEIDAPDRPGPWGDFLRSLRQGRWLFAHQGLATWSEAVVKAGESGGMPAVPAEDLKAIAAAIYRFRMRYPYFAPELKLLEKPLTALGKIAAADRPRRERLLPAVQDFEIAVGEFLAANPCPAPVYLDEPEPRRKSFSFLVGADVQYDTDGSSLQQFLTMIEPRRSSLSPEGDAPPAQVLGDLYRQIREAKFVVLAGDIGDGKGFSSSPNSLLRDGLGFTDARSPYYDGTRPGRGEFPELRAQFSRCSKPIFAVPGNHDGFTTFGGILNQLAAVLGAGLETLPLFSLLGTPLKETVAPDLPTLVRFWRIAPPFYDGLVDWTLELGPHNLAFNYRGLTFVGLNSFDLHQLERDQVGAIGNNWGGGLQEESLVWFDVALRHFSGLDRAARGLATPRDSAGAFVFMHHDPRASVAAKRGYVEAEFGYYNDVTSPFNELTLGYLGLSWATYSGLFIPIVSPIGASVLRSGSFGENFQERWMRHTVWDDSCYHARELLEVINRNLSGAPPIVREADGAAYRPAEITHLFFGHDDTPVVGPWIHPSGRAVFPDQLSDVGWNTVGEKIRGIYSRTQSKRAPEWGGAMRFYDGRQATVVRLDDIGDVFSKVNSHGFSLVTVRFPEDDEKPAAVGPPGAEDGVAGGAPAASRPRIDVHWIPLPR